MIWTVGIARAAEQDFEDILRWTRKQFGPLHDRMDLPQHKPTD